MEFLFKCGKIGLAGNRIIHVPWSETVSKSWNLDVVIRPKMPKYIYTENFYRDSICKARTV